MVTTTKQLHTATVPSKVITSWNNNIKEECNVGSVKRLVKSQNGRGTAKLT